MDLSATDSKARSEERGYLSDVGQLRIEFKRLRLARKCSQESIARELGITQASLSAWETGKNQLLRGHTLNKLIHLVNVWRNESNTLPIPKARKNTLTFVRSVHGVQAVNGYNCQERGPTLARRKESATERLNPDERFFVDHEAELMKAYSGRFVAIRHCEVTADAPTRRELEEILVRKYGAPAYAMVRRVTKSAFDFSPAGSILIS